MEILESLKNSEIVVDSQVREFKEFKRNYSYHWQTPKGKIIVRWDNAPHHKDISTFTNHKHI
jgi:hypothetical protein